MHFRRGFKATLIAFHLKCPPGNLETLLKKDFFIDIRFLVLQETRRPPSGGKTTPLGGWHGHLLVTPALHDAVQKASKLFGILEVSEFYG
jgi:hypothetical protein